MVAFFYFFWDLEKNFLLSAMTLACLGHFGKLSYNFS